jgi:hypothetical protein
MINCEAGDPANGQIVAPAAAAPAAAAAAAGVFA